MPTEAEAEMIAVYGTADLAQAAGVLHVAAVARTEEAADRILKIGPDSPKSPADAFALSLSRARADAIITTAKILRDEPAMVVEPSGAHAASLLAWRAQRRPRPPALLILSRGGVLPPAHPALSRWVRPIVVTGPEGAATLRRSGAASGLTVHEMEVPSIDGAITWARDRLGAETISIEAGPSTANALYGDPASEDPRSHVDELMLSVCEDPVPAAVVGGSFVRRARLRALFGAPVSDTVRREAGRWRIQRWRRAG